MLVHTVKNKACVYFNLHYQPHQYLSLAVLMLLLLKDYYHWQLQGLIQA